MSESLHIKMFTLGMWQTNCYVVHVDGHDRCWIVDAGFEPGAMLTFVQDAGLTPQKLLLTHAHIDHIAGIDAVRAVWPDVPIVIHPAETTFLTDPDLNLSGPFGMPITAPEATDTYDHGDGLELAGHRFEVRHTPGHSPGGVTLYCEAAGKALVGDTLFAQGIGRYDFPTSDGPTLMQSIQQQLLTLPDQTKICPGHGPPTTIAAERASNPFLQ
jgi:glyoxylase-like metal-dependent hydrolase (beta-lactamase superfamily II)